MTVGHGERGLRTISLILYLVCILYALFNPQSSSKYPLHRVYVGNCLKTSSYVLTEAFSRPKTCNYGVGRRHHGSSLPQILLSSCGLIKHSGPALLLLYLSGDLELNPGPAEGSQATIVIL